MGGGASAAGEGALLCDAGPRATGTRCDCEDWLTSEAALAALEGGVRCSASCDELEFEKLLGVCAALSTSGISESA